MSSYSSDIGIYSDYCDSGLGKRYVSNRMLISVVYVCTFFARLCMFSPAEAQFDLYFS